MCLNISTKCWTCKNAIKIFDTLFFKIKIRFLNFYIYLSWKLLVRLSSIFFNLEITKLWFDRSVFIKKLLFKYIIIKIQKKTQLTQQKASIKI